ncbi:hypothetical protein GWN26_13880 [Candidatus Saccharibacteria bacterium]|nr:TrbC/VirB2 family protein [Candidatus Saccharibacteria bacterium]NIV04375.1 hypothetical protein [Calditrichia bacterium]NIS38921.1 TrbC/VirB2 family protein [Candidatus Saccharibacteria bacterium]NIV72908.1 hypothetical protein [Calditrichia bacterium]NIW00142.1 hypothetical protein [Candidatus Saccharibacteria bacterium]
METKRTIKCLLIVLIVFIFAFPLAAEAINYYCWCQRPDGVCENHVHEDGTTGDPIVSQEQCNAYCYSRTTEGEHWQAKHFDDHWVDWKTVDKNDVCYEDVMAPTTEIPETPVEFQQLQPRLQVPDFDIRFSDIQVTEEGGVKYIDVPWLAQYIAAVYQYMVGVAVILAIVMIMYGGFRWIVAGGDAGKIGEAKKTIVQAVIGLAIALGSYTILSIINPNLVMFSSFRLALIDRQEYKFDSASFGLADDTGAYDDVISDLPIPDTDFISYKDMMQYCPSDKTDQSQYSSNYNTVIKYWMEALPKKVVYVGGGFMKGGICNASNGDNYLVKKLAKKGYEEWNGDIVAYRAWANSLGGTYCGDCLTFSRTIYRCIAGINPLPKKTNKSAAKYYYETTDAFLEDYNNNKLSIKPGTFIWLGGGCGHAINYTGIKGNEIIEMGGGPPKITINEHTANSVRVKPSLASYLEMKWIKKQDCPIYVHSILENPELY